MQGAMNMAKAVNYSGNVWIWEVSVAYRHEVEKYLNLVRTTQAGQTLFRHLNFRTNWLLIQPFVPTAKSPVNADATPKTWADAAPLGYIASVTQLTFPGIAPIDFPTSIGTGVGTTVYVHFHPATWTELNKRVGYISPGNGPGEVLYHEMVHGLRELKGQLRYRDKVVGEPDMDSVEEFYAIMAANVYRSERGFSHLRHDHRLFSPLHGDLRNPENYYQNYKTYIDQWFNEHRAYCLDMAKSPAKFNPFQNAAVELGLMPRPQTSMKL
jgi:Effector protein